MVHRTVRCLDNVMPLNMSVLNVVNISIATVLISRFLLDLQEVNQELARGSQSLTYTTSSNSSSIRFDRLIGPIGCSLSPTPSTHVPVESTDDRE